MTNFEMAQKIGLQSANKLLNGERADLVMVGMLEVCMELLAAIADHLGIPNEQPKGEECERD